MDGMGHLLQGQAVGHPQSGFRHQVGGMGAHDVRPQQATAVRSGHQLEEARQLAHGLGLAQLAHLEGDAAHVQPLFSGLLLAQAHAAHFGRGEHAGRHGIIAHGARLAAQALHHAQAFHGRHMGQHHTRGAQQVADGIHFG